MAFESLTELNAVKRGFRNNYLAMRQLPACQAKAGCGFALVVPPELAAQIEARALEIGMSYRLFSTASENGAVRYHLEREIVRK